MIPHIYCHGFQLEEKGMGDGYTPFRSSGHGTGDDDQDVILRWLPNSADVVGLSVVKEAGKFLFDVAEPSNLRAFYSQ